MAFNVCDAGLPLELLMHWRPSLEGETGTRGPPSPASSPALSSKSSLGCRAAVDYPTGISVSQARRALHQHRETLTRGTEGDHLPFPQHA